MERNYFNEGFESFLRDKSDEYKLYPSDKVWAQINRKLHPRKRWPFLAAALLLLGIGVGTRYMVEDQSANAVPETTSASASIPVQDALAETTPVTTQTRQSDPSTRTSLRVVAKNPNLVSRPAEPVMTASVNPEWNGINSSPAKEQLDQFVARQQALETQLTSEEAPPVPLSLARLTGSPADIETLNPEVNTPSRLGAFLAQAGKVGKKMSWQLYFSPSFSYRRLEGKASKYSYPYSAFPYSASYGFARDVKDAVRHRPSMGMELGTALIYPLNKRVRLKAGLQLNYNAYQVEAYSYVPELAPFGSTGPGSLSNSVSTTAYYRNFNGFDKTMLKNSHFMVSLPVGVELSVLGNDRVKLNVATTVQPTYIINNQAYMVSTNLKNYAQEPSLYRKWNVNAGAEAFLSINTGSFNWTIGPQLRYQLMSSYKENYPIKEHLMDLGLKVGVVKKIF